MKISDKGDVQIFFRDLSQGEVFRHAYKYYMKTLLVSGYNAVLLDCGTFDYFGDHDPIIKVKAELKIL